MEVQSHAVFINESCVQARVGIDRVTLAQKATKHKKWETKAKSRPSTQAASTPNNISEDAEQGSNNRKEVEKYEVSRVVHHA